MNVHFEAVVLGAGIGGLCAAARLAHGGRPTLLVEALPRVGGRASTEEIEGFLVATGAVALEFGGAFEETFQAVGASLDLRIPEPAVSFRIGGRRIDMRHGGWELLPGGPTSAGSTCKPSTSGCARRPTSPFISRAGSRSSRSPASSLSGRPGGSATWPT